jgi:methylmalonyl-CoA carboxyltransferase 12S subunit
MSEDQNAELLALVKSLSDRVNSLEGEIKSIKLLNAQNVPEETMVAIAAAVAGYMGFRAKRRAGHFTTSRTWQATTRRSQLSHAPLHLR